MTKKQLQGKLRREAYEVSLDIRKFEIELYWKRTKYFFDAFVALGGLTLVITALGLLDDGCRMRDIYPILVIIESAGLVAAVAWLLVNKGSKYWQENWEQYVNALGKPFIGSLFRYPIREGERLKRYSVSKINQFLSCFVAKLWLILLISTILLWISSSCDTFCLPVSCIVAIAIAVIVVLSIYTCVRMYCCCKGSNPEPIDELDPRIKEYLNSFPTDEDYADVPENRVDWQGVMGIHEVK